MTSNIDGNGYIVMDILYTDGTNCLYDFNVHVRNNYTTTVTVTVTWDRNIICDDEVKTFCGINIPLNSDNINLPPNYIEVNFNNTKKLKRNCIIKFDSIRSKKQARRSDLALPN